jgi:2-amino-4-hydroxy-6-hydroxymethyldihydropteridine diphosphokinase
MPSSRQALIGMGANLGDRLVTLTTALERLKSRSGVGALEVSPIYETDPVGEIEQPRFLNLVVGLETVLSPEELLERLLETERQFGRVRDVRWGPRTLDLDLLAFENETRATPSLTLPHPRMLERGFVIVPLRELLKQPRFQIEAWNELRRQIAAPISTTGIRRL